MKEQELIDKIKAVVLEEMSTDAVTIIIEAIAPVIRDYVDGRLSKLEKMITETHKVAQVQSKKRLATDTLKGFFSLDEQADANAYADVTTSMPPEMINDFVNLPDAINESSPASLEKIFGSDLGISSPDNMVLPQHGVEVTAESILNASNNVVYKDPSVVANNLMNTLTNTNYSAMSDLLGI